MNQQPSIISNSNKTKNFLLQKLASAMPDLNKCCTKIETVRGNLITATTKISPSEQVFAYQQRTPNGQAYDRVDVIKTMCFRGEVMKFRSDSVMIAVEKTSQESSGDCPVLRPTKKSCRKGSSASVNSLFKKFAQTLDVNTYTKGVDENFANKDSISMNRIYCQNSVAEDSPIRRSCENFKKPWSIFINDHATVENKPFDNGLKKMYLGLDKPRSFAKSLLKIVDSAEASKLSSLLDLDQRNPDQMTKSQIIAPTPKRATLSINLFAPPTTCSISPDPESVEKISFWNSLVGDDKDNSKLGREEINIFRPKSSTSKTFFTQKSYCGKGRSSIASTKSTAKRFLSVPVTDEEVALDSFVGTSKTLSRRIKKISRRIGDTSVMQIIKNIGTSIKPKSVTGMHGFKASMAALVNGYKIPKARSEFKLAKSEISSKGKISDMPSPSIEGLQTFDHEKRCVTHGAPTTNVISGTPDHLTRFKTLRPIKASDYSETPDNVHNVPKPMKRKTLKGSALIKTAIDLNRASPFKQLDAANHLNKYC